MWRDITDKSHAWLYCKITEQNNYPKIGKLAHNTPNTQKGDKLI